MTNRVGQQLGHYQLLHMLGQGSFAEVYLGEHRYLEVPAAIKVLNVRMEARTHEPFLREARIVARLQHPHIVRIHDFGFHDDAPYLVMEYAPHGTLRSLHPKGARLSPEQVVAYVKQIASALDYAHEQKVIHRDVKPENMLVNARYEVMLSDFGLAVVQHTLNSLSLQSPAGTPLYMAPEQIQRQPSAASDQYALGVMVYEWLCGEPPFYGMLFEVFSQHVYQPPPSLRARAPLVSYDTEQVIFRALAKEPQARFACVMDFARALEEACSITQRLSLYSPTDTIDALPKGAQAQDELSSTQPVPATQESDDVGEPTQPRIMAVTARQAESTPVQSSVIPSHSALPDIPAVTLSGVQRNRERLLRKVRAFWITGVLEHSLHGTSLIALGLQQQPEAITNPWQLELLDPAGLSHALPTGTSIAQVYDDAEGELLILGAPGSGKTTLLLELARMLLERAEHDAYHPLPIVFNLSSWSTKRLPLASWLIEELNDVYQVPRALGQAWVHGDQLLPLLDGLDEVSSRDRTACIAAINSYRQEHGLLPLVVCSRNADYLAQSARLRLGSAVMVQPLTQQQVDDYLARGGEPLRTLRQALQQDAELRAFANTPLMLSILTLTYHDIPVEDLLQRVSFTERQQQIFARYVERMLARRTTDTRYTPEQTTRWLSWLARQMKLRSQTVFYIEHIQPAWLTDTRTLRTYDRFGIRLPNMLTSILVSLAAITFLSPLSPMIFVVSVSLGGLLGAFWSGRHLAAGFVASEENTKRTIWPRTLWRLGSGGLVGLLIALALWQNLAATGGNLFLPLLFWLCFGLSFVLSFGLWHNQFYRLLAGHTARVQRSPARQRLVDAIRRPGVSNGILTGLLFTCIFVAIFVLTYNLIYGLTYALSFRLLLALPYIFVYSLIGGLLIGLALGLAIGLNSGFLSIVLPQEGILVRPVDRLVWSWRSLRSKLFSRHHIQQAGVVALIIWLIAIGFIAYFLLLQQQFTLVAALLSGLIDALIVGLDYWLLLGLLQGVSSTAIEDQRRALPNQGIHRSAFNGMLLGLVSMVIVWLTFLLGHWLSIIWAGAQGISPQIVFYPGLFAGLVIGLLNGGLACLRHYVLRCLLWRSNTMPWNYPHFLDYAAEHVLLRKVGGGYIFIHRLVLDYFADLPAPPPPPQP